MGIDGVEFASRANRMRPLCTFTEIALLEVLRDWSALWARSKTVSELASAVATRQADGLIDLDRVADVALDETKAVRHLLQVVRAELEVISDDEG